MDEDPIATMKAIVSAVRIVIGDLVTRQDGDREGEEHDDRDVPGRLHGTDSIRAVPRLFELS